MCLVLKGDNIEGPATLVFQAGTAENVSLS